MIPTLDTKNADYVIVNLHFSKKDPYQKYASTPKSILKISNFQITNFTERGLSWIFVPSSLLMVFFFLNLKKRKFLSFYCRTSLCVLIDLVQQGVLLSYNLTRLILAHAGNKIIVVQSKSCLSFHFYLIPLLVFIRDSTCNSFWFVWYL